MHKPVEHHQIRSFMVPHKIPGCVVHPGHERIQALQNGHAVAPSQGRRKQASHLHVHALSVTVRDGQGVVGNEIGHLMQRRLLQQKLLQRFCVHHAKIELNLRRVGQA